MVHLSSKLSVKHIWTFNKATKIIKVPETWQLEGTLNNLINKSEQRNKTESICEKVILSSLFVCKTKLTDISIIWLMESIKLTNNKTHLRM